MVLILIDSSLSNSSVTTGISNKAFNSILFVKTLVGNIWWVHAYRCSGVVIPLGYIEAGSARTQRAPVRDAWLRRV